MSFRSFVRYVAPYGYMMKRHHKEYDIIESMLLNYNSDGIDFTKGIESKYKTIVSVQGFGYSGSGTVVDLLREFDNCKVIGYVSVEGSKTSRKRSMAEIDIVRLSGGLFDIEKYIESTNIFHNDALINRTAKLFAHSCLFNIPELRPLFVAFLNQLIDFKLPNLSSHYYNSYLYDSGEKGTIYFMKQMKLQQFRRLSSNFLNAVLNFFYTGTEEYFVGDQMLTDEVFDIKRDKEYLPNLKTIFIPRDPRDLYAWTNYKKVEWIPQDLQGFLKWYKIMYSPLKKDIGDSLVISYEDMCLDYDNQYEKIVDYLELSEKNHKCPKECFNPDVSKKYVNIWKSSPVNKSDFEIINNELREFCSPIID